MLLWDTFFAIPLSKFYWVGAFLTLPWDELNLLLELLLDLLSFSSDFFGFTGSRNSERYRAAVIAPPKLPYSTGKGQIIDIK